MKFERVSKSIVFKESISKLSKSMGNIVSILNKDGEGVLYFDIKPDGEVCGQEITEKTLNDVVENIKTSIKPMTYTKIEAITIDVRVYNDCVIIDGLIYYHFISHINGLWPTATANYKSQTFKREIGVAFYFLFSFK